MSKNSPTGTKENVTGAQPTSRGEAVEALASNSVAAPQDANAAPVNSTAHLTLPATSLRRGVAGDGRLDDEHDEAKAAKVRRIYLLDPNAPDSTVIDPATGDTLGAYKAREAAARTAATSSTPALASTEVTTSTSETFEPTGSANDERRVAIVTEEVKTPEGDARSTGATEYAVTVAPESTADIGKTGQASDSNGGTPSTDTSASAPAPSTAPATATSSSTPASSSASTTATPTGSSSGQ